MAYQLEGSLLEICSCNVMCPCWVGEDPTGGSCDGVLAWRVDSGTVEGVDVAGFKLALLVHIPGNALNGNWRAVIYVDDQSTPQQEEAMLNLFTGKLGGPVADLAGLVGEVTAVERAPIAFDSEGGTGSMRVGQVIEAQIAPVMGASGNPTLIQDTMLLPAPPGETANVAKASVFHVGVPNHGFTIDINDHSAVQSPFRFVG